MPYFQDPPERNEELENVKELLQIYRERNARLRESLERAQRDLYKCQQKERGKS